MLSRNYRRKNLKKLRRKWAEKSKLRRQKNPEHVRKICRKCYRTKKNNLIELSLYELKSKLV